MKHNLKIWPPYYCRIADGSKTFEVRENDRGFQPGDTVLLREYDPEDILKVVDDPTGMMKTHCFEEPKGYTGRELLFTVGYVLPINDKQVVFSLLKAPL